MRKLRIFYAVINNPTLWYNNFYLSLVSMGHEIIPFEYNIKALFRKANIENQEHRLFVLKNRHKLEQALIKQIKKEHNKKPIDLFFSYFYSSCATPNTIKEIGSLGIPTVNWYCNATHQFHLIKDLAPAYDFCLTPEKERIEDYRRIGANPVYMMYGANPKIYKPYKVRQEFDVTFVGQKFGDRPKNIKRLLDEGVNVKIWGAGWQINKFQKESLTKQRITRVLNKIGLKSSKSKDSFRHLENGVYGPLLSDEEMVKMYSRSKISLGSTITPDDQYRFMKLRDFEAPMSRAFYLVDYWYEIEDYYKVGKEVVCYEGIDDLIDKVKYYLTHENERETIRKAGLKRARSQHAWENRFNDFFKKYIL